MYAVANTFFKILEEKLGRSEGEIKVSDNDIRAIGTNMRADLSEMFELTRAKLERNLKSGSSALKRITKPDIKALSRMLATEVSTLKRGSKKKERWTGTPCRRSR